MDQTGHWGYASSHRRLHGKQRSSGHHPELLHPARPGRVLACHTGAAVDIEAAKLTGLAWTKPGKLPRLDGVPDVKVGKAWEQVWQGQQDNFEILLGETRLEGAWEALSQAGVACLHAVAKQRDADTPFRAFGSYKEDCVQGFMSKPLLLSRCGGRPATVSLTRCTGKGGNSRN